jgi:hypothetical protein
MAKTNMTWIALIWHDQIEKCMAILKTSLKQLNHLKFDNFQPLTNLKMPEPNENCLNRIKMPEPRQKLTEPLKN